MARINTKQEFYGLYKLGILGNRALAWNSYNELLKSKWRGGVCIRGENIPRKEVRFDIPFEKVPEEIEKMEKVGINRNILRFNQSMPNDDLVIQGEVIDYIGGWHLTYTTVKKPMLQGMKQETRFAKGLTAKIILKTCMDPSSFEDLNAIMEIYSDSVTEFSTYSINVGDIKGRNTVFWEVRDY